MKTYWAAIMVGMVVAGTSCTTPPSASVVRSALPPPEVRLDVGDEIEIKFPYQTGLNETLRIRPDGKIALQIVDEVQAAGLTPAELDEALTALYAREITNPSLTVIVRELSSQRVFVGGEVTRPGMVAIPGKLTALEAVFLAGGPVRSTAKADSIVVIRHVGDKRYATLLDLGPAFGGQPHTPFMLAPNDMVYIPRTSISRVNQWVDQYINDLFPSTFIRFSRSRGDTTYGYGR